MTVTRFQDLPLADRDREWDGDAADTRVRRFTDAEDGPTPAYLPKDDVDRVKSHLAKYYAKMGDTAPWER